MSFSAPIDVANSQPAAANDEEKTDFSQLSLADFLRDARVPIGLRDSKILQIQKASQNNAEMKVSDFLRRDIPEEEAHLLKKQRELQDWLDQMRFRQLNAEIKGFISEQKTVINSEIETIQQAVNTLLVDDGDHHDAIGGLRDARSEFKDQARELNKLERARQSARTEDDLRAVQVAMQTQARRVATTRNNWRQTLMNHWNTITTNVKNSPLFGKISATISGTPASATIPSGGDDEDETSRASADVGKPEFDPS